jgi:hypothetical protein
MVKGKFASIRRITVPCAKASAKYVVTIVFSGESRYL